MKISVGHILIAHYFTMRNATSNRISKSDIFIFYIFPCLVGAGGYFISPGLDRDFYNISITFFGIFIALLLNIQVAIFGVFQRNWTKPSDNIYIAHQEDKADQKRELLRELNVNVSYLIVLSCFCLAVYVVLFSLKAEGKAINIISTVLYLHFLLTLLMTVKRTHALFQGEYDIGA